MSNGCHTHGQKIWKPDRKSSLGHYPASEQAQRACLPWPINVPLKINASIQLNAKMNSKSSLNSPVTQLLDKLQMIFLTLRHSMFVLLMYINQED